MANRLVMSSEDLKGAVAFASKILPRRSLVPVLSHVRITAGDSVRIEATDLENRVSLGLPRLGGDGAFEAVLPGRELSQYLKGGLGSEVALSVDGLTVDFDDRAKIVGWEPSDFPGIPDAHAWERVAAIKPAELERAMKAVAFARSTEPVRYALTGTLLEIARGGMKGHLVASDGKRLSACPFAPAGGHAFRGIVNAVASSLSAGLAKRAQSEVVLEKTGDVDPVLLRFTAGDSWILTKAVDGHFPDWQAVVPSIVGRLVWKVSPEALARAIATAKFAVSEKTGAMKFDFAPEAIKVFAKSQDRGEATGTCPARGPGMAELGAKAAIVLNASYVAEYLESVPKKTQEIEIALGSPDQAAIFRIPGHGSRYVLMPLTVSV